MATYMVIIQGWPAHLALAPIAQADPPFMPFRDAGYSQADFTLTIQDVVYGVWRAIREKLLDLDKFDVDVYEQHERVEFGDFNWITPSFLAFASPMHKPIAVIHPSHPLFATLPQTMNQVIDSKTLPNPFKWVLTHFVDRNIGLVVRLNSELYSPSYFTALGINHVDMIFDDGTCPSMSLVRRFVAMAHQTIAEGKGIAVHCKAGLGRTGCLIGAYLIYRHGFTANEIIAFMRFMRPGMVVGPQQHWLHLHQGRFREWWFEDTVKEKLLAMQMQQQQQALAPKTPVKKSQHAHQHQSSRASATPLPPLQQQQQQQQQPVPARAIFAQVDGNGASNQSRSPTSREIDSDRDENLPAPTPGQPRKSYRKPSSHAPAVTALSTFIHEDADTDPSEQRPTTEIIAATYHGHRHRASGSGSGSQSTAAAAGAGAADSDEEWQLQMVAQRRTAPRSQSSLGRFQGRRAATCGSNGSPGSGSWLDTGSSTRRAAGSDVQVEGVAGVGGGEIDADADVENQIMAEVGEAMLHGRHSTNAPSASTVTTSAAIATGTTRSSIQRRLLAAAAAASSTTHSTSTSTTAPHPHPTTTSSHARYSSRSGSGAGSLVGMHKLRRESPRRAAAVAAAAAEKNVRSVGMGPEGVRKASSRLVSGGGGYGGGLVDVEKLAEGLRRSS